MNISLLWSLGELKMFLWTEDFLKEIGLEVKIHTQISAIDFYLRFLLLLLMTNRHNFNLAKLICFIDVPDELPLRYSQNFMLSYSLSPYCVSDTVLSTGVRIKQNFLSI